MIFRMFHGGLVPHSPKVREFWMAQLLVWGLHFVVVLRRPLKVRIEVRRYR